MASDLFGRNDTGPDITPAVKLTAAVDGVYRAAGNDFRSRNVGRLELGFEGIEGDFHRGITRKSGGREPWYPRGTEMRNERQLSIVAPDELRDIARAMDIAEVRPEWIGANMVLSGIHRLSMLPPGTLMFFNGGVTLKVDGQNRPCRVAGKSVAESAGVGDSDAAALKFAEVARRLRGLVAWVEKPGSIAEGEEVSVRLPEQWIYEA